MDKTGGKRISEQTVVNALRWLQKNQNPNGTWGKGQVGAMTGLALLCYLGHGETPQSASEFSGVVAATINAYVAEGTKSDGRMTFYGKDFAAGPSPYTHGIGTYAICEAYTMSKDERLVPIIKKAINYIVEGQGADGGWMYSYSKAVPSDTSVSGWQIQALKAAFLTDLNIETVPRTLDKAMKNLERVFSPRNGSFGYRNANDRNYALTGGGVLSKIYWQGHADARAISGIESLVSTRS